MIDEAEPGEVCRRARSEDVDDIARIAAASFAEPWSRETIADELSGPGADCFVLADESSGPVAYLLARRVLDELHVMHIAVDAEKRRGGRATRLLEHALARALAEGGTRAHLEVRASNAAALGFYRKHRFVAVGQRPRYYGPEEDAVLMTRAFGSGT